MGHFEGFNLCMSKCHVRELSRVYECLFGDAAYAYPTLQVEFERDLVRLLVLVERRGLRVFLEDLPAVGKHLDRCLAGGQYNLSGLPLTKRFSNRVVIPKFLRGLYLLVFHENGLLKEDYDVQAVFFLRQLLYAAKKATVQCSPEKVSNEVVEFFEIDSLLPEPDGFWSTTDLAPSPIEETYCGYSKSPLYAPRVESVGPHKRSQLSVLLAKLDFVSSFVTTTLGSYDPRDWSFRHGPGAVSESIGPSNKYCWKSWSDTLETEFPIADYGFHSFASWADRCQHFRTDGSREPSSRMVAVPKSYSKPRLIAAEPGANQFCQQNLWHYFGDRTSDSWLGGFVRFRDQSLNQNLCSIGASDGTLATVDLSAASDRVTCHFVGQLFRSNPRLLRALRSTRTRFVEQTLTPRVPRLIALRKFSTMGNACTFPVESLAFLSVAIAAVLTVRRLKASPQNVKDLIGQVAVFGDDIVIPVDSRELFVDALEVFHFKVNAGKSYWTGKFRESCGVDSFGGVNVTPAYWKTIYDGKPGTLASVAEASNNFYKKFLLRTSAYLASQLPEDVPQVAMRSGVFGLKARCKPFVSHLKMRVNLDLQRAEFRVMSLSATQNRTPVGDDSAILQYFTEAPDPFSKWSSGISERPRMRMRPRWVPQADILAQ